MKKLKFLFVSFIFIVFVFDVGAAEKQNSSLDYLTKISSIEEKHKAEISLMEKQLSAMKEYHSSLLDTVYWTLTTVAGIAFLLVGYGWFTNFKLHESEKVRLKEDFENRLNDVVSGLEVRFSKINSEIIKSVDERYDSYISRVNRDNDILRSELLQIKSDISKGVDDLNSKVGLVDKRLDIAFRRIAMSDASMRQVEEYVWESRGIPLNVFITQVQGLRAALEAMDDFSVKSTLLRIEKCINDRIIPADASISKEMYESMREDVGRASGIDAALTNRVLVAMGNMKVKS